MSLSFLKVWWQTNSEDVGIWSAMFCYGKHAVLQAPCRSLITGQSGLLHICRNCGFASYKLLPQKYNRLGKAASIDKAVKIIQEYVDTLSQHRQGR